MSMQFLYHFLELGQILGKGEFDIVMRGTLINDIVCGFQKVGPSAASVAVPSSLTTVCCRMRAGVEDQRIFRAGVSK